VSDGCGLHSGHGLNLAENTLKNAAHRFKQQSEELGGNRFVDALDFGPINDALKNHPPWRNYLEGKIGSLSEDDYQAHFDFRDLRNAVMHGRAPFPTYSSFKVGITAIGQITQFIVHLEAYPDRRSDPIPNQES
jgi:hypothetical protein